MFALIGFYFKFLVLWLLYYSCLHPALPLVFYFTSLLLLSYYTMHVLCLLSFTISLPAPVCLYSRHHFLNICSFDWIYRYMCAYLCTQFGIRITTCWGVLTPLDLHVQISELGTCGFSRLLIKVAQRQHGSSANRLWPHPSRAPCSPLQFFFCNS